MATGHTLPTFEMSLRFAGEAALQWCAAYRYGRRFVDGNLGIWNERVNVNVGSPCRATGNCFLQFLFFLLVLFLNELPFRRPFPCLLSAEGRATSFYRDLFLWLTLRLFFGLGLKYMTFNSTKTSTLRSTNTLRSSLASCSGRT